MSKSKILPVLALCAAVVLSGCFRQADETFDEVTLAPATSSGLGITSVPVTSVLGPTNTVPLLITLAVTETPGTLATEAASGQSLTVTPARTFITPGSPLGTFTVPTITPTLGPTETITPGGLITPTDFFDADEAGVNSACEYEVRGGDTLYSIALRNRTTITAIREANELANDTIFPGDILIIPGCNDEDETESADAPDAPDVPEGFIVHIVQSGEVLGAIAERYGVGQSVIVSANNLTNPNALSVGQRLLIPVPTETP
ncbi:MAG: LysM peptidoglycan-binding domain-containing protein [Chloroflexi bacterium]|nr:LysM peptidoglycan-binding domain-containing protein [Chloroflexota bacterium]